MVLMRSPEGKERDIVDDGVAALESLGWERAETEQATPPASTRRKK